METPKNMDDKLKELKINWNIDESSDNLFQDLQASKVTSLNEVISEINLLIETRRTLSLEIFKDANKTQMDLKNFMADLGALMTPNNPNIPALMELKKKQAEMEEMKMNEKVNCWKDIAKLKEELRTYIKESKDKQRRMDVMNQMMEVDEK